jgi:cystathionine beta-lyase
MTSWDSSMASRWLSLSATAAATVAASLVWFVFKKKRQTPCDFDEPVDRSGIHAVKYELSLAKEAIQLWVADMDLPVASCIRRRLIQRALHPAGVGYTIQPSQAWEAVCQWLQTNFAWEVQPSELVFSASVVTSVANIVRTFSEEEDSVLCMTPLFHPLQAACGGRNLVKHELQLGEKNRYQIDFQVLENQIVDSPSRIKILLLCNPHNPSGRVWTKTELLLILNLCEKHDILIISDEIWSDWVLSWCEHPHTPIASLPGASERCFTLMAPTKTWNLAGLHSSFVIIQNTNLRERYMRAIEPACLHYGSAFATEALLATYGASTDKFGKHEANEWLQQCKRYVQGNIEFLQTYCQCYIPQVQVWKPNATYLVWIDCGACENAFQKCLEANVVLSPGHEFGSTSAHKFVRINVATNRATLQTALERMRIALQR